MTSPYDTPQYHALMAFWGEPDYFETTLSGFKAIARRNWSKAWCGYVGVPDTHPLFGKDYHERIAVKDRGKLVVDKVPPMKALVEALQPEDGKASLSCLINVHGGLTYANSEWPADDGLWYFGFDCSHYNDLSPKDVFQSFSGGIWQLSGDTTYRTLDYVKEEMQTLASALRSLSCPAPNSN